MGYPARIGENVGIADQDSIGYQLRKILIMANVMQTYTTPLLGIVCA